MLVFFFLEEKKTTWGWSGFRDSLRGFSGILAAGELNAADGGQLDSGGGRTARNRRRSPPAIVVPAALASLAARSAIKITGGDEPKAADKAHRPAARPTCRRLTANYLRQPSTISVKKNNSKNQYNSVKLSTVVELWQK